MSTNVVQFRKKPRTEFDCPKCGCCSNIANVGRVHWGLCKSCGIRWCIGENLFSGWREESEADWERNRRELAAYRQVRA
jgi:hypothetical protein